MGILPVSNHLNLIKDCYPLKLLTTIPISELKADSNSLSKLCFYAAGRPKKIPKVTSVILERAKINKSTSGIKARATLAVTIDIMRGLVGECRSELRCFALDALMVVELALTRRNEGHRDTELESRGAGLFHAIATFASGPFLGLDRALANQYLRCLSLLSEMAQLGSSHAESRWIALKAINGAVTSETLYGVASNYESQIEHIVPALLFNCLDISIQNLREQSHAADSIASTSQIPSLASRKSPTISLPSPSPPSTTELASKAIHSLRIVYKLSHGSQLTTKLSVMSLWLDQFKNGSLWNEIEFIEWIGINAVESSAIQYRAGVVTWWAEQIIEMNGKNSTNTTTARPITLLTTLSSILKGPTSLVGLGIGGVLSQLTTLLIRRASSPSISIPIEAVGEEDPITPLIISAISALGSHIYYSDQMNDIASDLIDTIKSIGAGRGESNSLDEIEKNKTMSLLIQALVGVMNEVKLGSNQVERAVPVERVSSDPKTESSTSNLRPTLPTGNLTVRGNGVITGSGQGMRSKKEGEADSKASSSNGNGMMDGLGKPIMRIAGSGKRHRISPETFQPSLFLLTHNSPLLRFEYQKCLLLYISEEMEIATSTPSSIGKEDTTTTFDPSKETSLFLNEVNSSIFELATCSSISSTPSSSSLSRATSTKVTNSTEQISNSRKSSTSSSKTSLKQIFKNSLASSSSPLSISTQDLPLPVDYSNLQSLIIALQSRGSASSLLSSVPMLFALQKKAELMAEESGESKGLKERSIGCRELVANGLNTIGKTWEIEDLKSIAGKTLEELQPLMIPTTAPLSLESQFTNQTEKFPSPFSTGLIIESLAASQSLQAASGLDRTGIISVLSANWSPEIARASISSQPVYRRIGSRSVINLSNIRITSTPDSNSKNNFRASLASLADLQQSLGRSRSGSSRTSMTPSLASTNATNGTEFLSVDSRRRRTSKTSTSNVLLALNSSSTGSRLSLVR